MRAALVLALAAMLAGCNGPELSGIATGLEPVPGAPLVAPFEATFAFEPFPGVPGNVGDELLRRIWRRMEREGLAVQKRPGGVASYRVVGALTAVSDDTTSQVFYVFDVVDPTGTRVHRIAGRALSDDSAGDPWANVTTDDLDVIARRVSALLRAWLYADG